MKYTPATIAKALFAGLAAFSAAATAAAGGLDLSSLTAGQWMTAVGAMLVAAGGTFGIPNKSTEPVVSTADQAITAIQNTVQQAAAAKTELERVQQAATAALNNVPILGPLATQILSGLPRLP